jgi:hypothetical protein
VLLIEASGEYLDQSIRVVGERCSGTLARSDAASVMNTKELRTEKGIRCEGRRGFRAEYFVEAIRWVVRKRRDDRSAELREQEW